MLKTQIKRYSMVTSLLGAALAMLGVALLAGCPDDEAAMTQQIGSSRPGATTSTPAKPKPATGDPAALPAGVAPDATESDPEESAEEAYTGPMVVVTDFAVKIPYPEFTGAGRYDIDVSVEVAEPTNSGVWKILVFDAEGNEVGTQMQFLMIPFGRPKPLSFNAFYCSEVPASVEFRLTDKSPATAGEEEDDGLEGGSGRGAQNRGN